MFSSVHIVLVCPLSSSGLSFKVGGWEDVLLCSHSWVDWVHCRRSLPQSSRAASGLVGNGVPWKAAEILKRWFDVSHLSVDDSVQPFLTSGTKPGSSSSNSSAYCRLWTSQFIYRGLGERSALIGCRVSIRSRCMGTWGWKGLNELTTAGIWSEMLTDEEFSPSEHKRYRLCLNYIDFGTMTRLTSIKLHVLIVDCTQSQWFPSPSRFQGSSYWL